MTRVWLAAVQIDKLTKAASADGFRGVDVLLTCEWPFRTHHHVPPALHPTTVTPIATIGSQVISDLAVQLWPRYHFAGGQGVFFARPPYANPTAGGPDTNAPKKLHVTRFVALGSVAKKSDKSTKWMHALNLEPMAKVGPLCTMQIVAAIAHTELRVCGSGVQMSDKDLLADFPNTTPCPYVEDDAAAAPPPAKRQRNAYGPSGGAGFGVGAGAGPSGFVHGGPGGPPMMPGHMGPGPMGPMGFPPRGPMGFPMGGPPMASGALTPEQIARIEAEGAGRPNGFFFNVNHRGT